MVISIGGSGPSEKSKIEPYVLLLCIYWWGFRWQYKRLNAGLPLKVLDVVSSILKRLAMGSDMQLSREMRISSLPERVM
jgi:hypothetical protein